MRDGGFRPAKEHRRPDLVPTITARLDAVPAGAVAATWIGHATYLLRHGAGPTILTDPVFAPSLPGGIKRLHPPAVALRELPRVDAVVVSHNHYDHMDRASLKGIAHHFPDVRFFVPLGTKGWFDRQGLHATELDWFEHAQHKGARFTLTPVHHWTRRTPWDTNDMLWGGWRIDVAGHPSTYFAGDTAYGPRFRETRIRLGPVDLALMPIGAYCPRDFMQGAHVDPDEAVAAALDLEAGTMASMHWGTFLLSREPLDEPLHRVRRAWDNAGRPRAALWDMAIGETRVLPANAPMASRNAPASA